MTTRGRAFTVVQAKVGVDDPHLTTDNRDRLSIRFSIYDALVHRSGLDGYSPRLAEHWTCDAEARSWTFNIRDDVRFHDGTMLGVADVAASLDRARNPSRGGELGTGGLVQGYLSEATIEVVNSRQLRVRLPEPMADLLDLLADIPIIPARLQTAEKLEPIGTGPYRVVDASDDVVTMSAFHNHWANSRTHELVRWIAEPDGHRRARLLVEGTAEVGSDIPAGAHQMLSNSSGLDLLERPSSTCIGFICNCFRGPCANLDFRLALNYGVNVSHIIQVVANGKAQRLNGPLTPLHLGYDPDVPAYPYDIGLAWQHLAKSGWESNAELVLDIPTTVPSEAPVVAECMAADYQALGIATRIRTFADRPAYAQMVRAKDVDDACCFDSTPLSTFRVFREKLRADIQGPWWLGYRNASVDSVLGQAATTPALSQRQKLYRRVHRMIRNDAPWIFLYSPNLVWGCSSNADWKPTEAGLVRLVD